MKVEKQLKLIDNKAHAVAVQKKRIVDLYVSGELEQEEYVRRIRGYEKEADTLTAKRVELLKYVPLFQKPELIRTSVTTYCEEIRKRFKQCVNFETKRQFFLDFVTKVAYQRKGKTYAKIRLYGTVPIQLDSLPETVTAEFKVERVLNSPEIYARLPKGQQDDDVYYGTHKAPLPRVQLTTL